MDFICETALLTHGLFSVTQERLREEWLASGAAREAALAWVDRGRLVLGGIDEYLPFRARAAEACRIDCDALDAALAGGVTGALTASGTMAACARLGAGLAVTCGMGGIGDVAGEELCPDLPALARYGVALVAASPKDMLDIPGTLGWLAGHGVTVAAASPEAPARCTGYVFESADVPVGAAPEGGWDEASVRRVAHGGGLLLLNPIPASERVRDPEVLASAVRAGHEAEARGEYYHPAANREIDHLTGGASSVAQLKGLIANVEAAAGI